MITDKIKFPPHYAKADSKTFASAGVESKGLSPERIWRNLANISVWSRLYPDIVDINFEDSSDNDPHLFDKAQFYMDMANGNKIRCQVIEYTMPKDDRVGRLAFHGTVYNHDGKVINEMTAEAIVGVPDNEKRMDLVVEGALSFKEETADAPSNDRGAKLEIALRELVKWSEKHD